MASKNTPQKLLDEGFDPAQFGLTNTTWTAYAQALLDDATQNVLERAGAAQYASADASVALHVRLAELYLAAADLWRRRINRLNAETVIGSDGVESAAAASFRSTARDYAARAEIELAAISATAAATTVTSSATFGATNSTHFKTSAADSPSAVGGILP